jgi:hypothetical protein
MKSEAALSPKGTSTSTPIPLASPSGLSGLAAFIYRTCLACLAVATVLRVQTLAEADFALLERLECSRWVMIANQAVEPL